MENIHLFSSIASYLEVIIVRGGYTILFFTTLLEGIPLMGMAVPGHVSIIIAGFLAKIGALDIWYVIIIASIGAILGDYIGYILGKKYGMKFIDRLRPFFFIRDEYIEKANKLLSEHTGKAMIVGRFSPVTRALMPFLVGANRIHAKKFWIFNILGGISWVIISVFIGYLFGASYHAAAGYFGKLVVIMIFVSAIIVWGYRFVNMRYHIFTKYELFNLGLNVIALWVLAKTIQDAISPHSFMANFDIWVNSFVANHVGHVWVVLSAYLSWIADSTAIVVVGGFIGFGLLLKRKWRRAAIMLLSIGSAGVILNISKDFFMRARPDNAIQALSSFSFPSGHATMAAVFFTVLAYLVTPKIKSRMNKELFMVLCVLLTIAIGLSRIILNVHWTSDVVGGWALGVFLATGSILFVRYVGALVIKKMV